MDGIAPLIDAKDSQTGVTTITKEMIDNIPNTQFVAGIVNLAPGVTKDSAYGAADNAVQYQVDGVDVSDPELGTAYLFLDYGVIDEVKIMGIGAPAEYGGYTGIVFNTVTKTGGNNTEGTFDSFIQLDTWNSKNSDDPDLSPPKIGYYNFHFSIGGPFKKDKLWYFLGTQYYQSKRTPAGFPDPSVYHQPRTFFKLTWQPNQDNRLSAFIEADIYNGNNRGASALTTPEATRDQKSPEMAFNLSYLRVISDQTFIEAKVAGFTSYYKLIPHMGYDVSGHYDWATDERTENWDSYYHAYRTRLQVNASVSHHADDFIIGNHDFKFGVEAEMNPTRTEWGFAADFAYRDWYGEPYYAYGYEGYDFKATNTRITAFIQDSWAVTKRVNINPGIRFNYYRGKINEVGTVFKPKSSIAPRIGATIDLLGDGSTALKFHYGKYYENIITSYYTAFAPKPDWIAYYWDGAQFVEHWRDTWDKNTYKMDPDISMPYMHQYTIGIEREVIKDLSVAVNYIHRTNHDFIDRVNLTGDFEAETFMDNGNAYTVYNQLNPGDNNYIVTNPKKGETYGAVFSQMVAFTPTREYTGYQFVLNKRFSNRWQLMASYTHGKATGSNDNDVWTSRSSGVGYSSLFNDPNYQINADGRLAYDPTHMLKIQGSIILPLDINFSVYYAYISGDTYNRYIRVPLDHGSPYIYAETKGLYRYPAYSNLDIRVSKMFKVSKLKLFLMVDIFNLLNENTINSVTTTSGQFFGDTVSIVNPRRFRAGVRVTF